MKKFLLLIVFFGIHGLLFSQNRSVVKQATAVRIENTIRIDGELDEAEWQNAPVAKDFVNYNPSPGSPSSQKCEVRILYDDKAIYFGAFLYDTSPDSILRQLSQRDDIGISDWFAVILDTYRDGLNGVGYVVTSAGVQYDTKYSALGGINSGGFSVLGGDRNWDAVWQSKTTFRDNGWVAEIKIPYSAIRFPKAENQLWNINFARMIRREREESFWNEVKPEITGLLNQSGQLAGISNIKSPVRLSATPFIVTYLENYHDKTSDPKSTWGSTFNAGIDLKYGINDAFTLDMTLIPDFGQARSDNQILNLSPYEVRFDENRQFFTEGTELFNKGDIFYSRRIGGLPLKHFEAYSHVVDSMEEVTENPLVSQLYNATKISGRTNSGLGIGLFNAVSQRTFATIKNKENGSTREFETIPLTNYNVFVLDQNLKNNSFVTLINTNVWRSGHVYDANVTGTQFSLRNKENSYAIEGGGAVSQKYFSGTDTASETDSVGLGYKYDLNFSKTSGNFQYSLYYYVISRHFDPNDLGFLFRPNVNGYVSNFGYNIFKPFGNFIRFGTNVSVEYTQLQAPNEFSDFAINWSTFLVTKNFLGFGLNGRFEPFVTYDFYDPRSADFSRFYSFPTNASVGGFISTDYRKTVAYDADIFFRDFETKGRHSFSMNFSPRIRASDKLFILFNLNFTNLSDDVGFVPINENAEGYDLVKGDEITYSVRDQLIFDNQIWIDYIFTNNMSLNFRARHYLTRLDYNSFHLLGKDGLLYDTPYTGIDAGGVALHNGSFNIFNIDLIYRWRFAPGSDLYFIWKNFIVDDSPHFQKSYFENARDLLDAPQLNSFSIKLIYFLDYLDVVKPRG